MCDLDAGLVDSHVPRLAACLCDDHEVVRRQALALLAHLLQKVRFLITSLASGSGTMLQKQNSLFATDHCQTGPF